MPRIPNNRLNLIVGRPEHVYAAFEHNGVLTMLGNNSKVTRISLERTTRDETAMPGRPPGLADMTALVSETDSVRVEILRGDFVETNAIRARISHDVMAHLRRNRGHRRTLLMVASALVGLFVGIAGTVGLMPVPGVPAFATGNDTMPPMPSIAEMGLSRPPLPPSKAPVSKPVTDTDSRVSHPEHPVSLDDKSQTNSAQGQSSNMPRPVSTMDSQVRAPDTGTVPAIPPLSSDDVLRSQIPNSKQNSEAKQLSEINRVQNQSGDMSKATSAMNSVQAHGTDSIIHEFDTRPSASPATQSTDGTVASADELDAKRTLLALENVRQALISGTSITPDMLRYLPKGIAEKIAALPRVEHIPQQVVDSGEHDKYGIPAIPDTMSWANEPSPRLGPLGGGSSTNREDLEKFGFPVR